MIVHKWVCRGKRVCLNIYFAILLVFFVLNTHGQSNSVSIDEMKTAFLEPAKQYSPETWFHFNGNNISKEGITLDLEAIEYAGIQGIHLFSKNGQPYPGVEQIKILSPEWEDMVRHTADECQRLGLKFTMQNCPGWSMTGGPWVPVEEAQRQLVESVFYLSGNQQFNDVLELVPEYKTEDYDYKDVQVLAFPTPKDDDFGILIPKQIETNNQHVPWSDIMNPHVLVDVTNRQTPENIADYKALGIGEIDGEPTWVKVKFDKEVTLRSLQLSPFRYMVMDRQYPIIDLQIHVAAINKGKITQVAEIQIPNGNWDDRQMKVTLAIPKTTSNEFIFSFEGEHGITPGIFHLSSQPRLHNHEAKAAKAMRSLEKQVNIIYDDQCHISAEKIINLTDKMDAKGRLTWDAPEGHWTVVRFGHVNMRRTNKPAMPESTGWECSKLDKVAIENHLRNGMIGQMIKDGGPIGDGKLAGLLIDSWESDIPTWTINSADMFVEFEQRRGYSMKKYLPATMGYIVESSEVSTKFLRDLRQTMDEVYIDNFFSHFATIAHEMGAEVYTEGAGGEVLPVDPMRYYGVSDNPMTEFWYPKAPSNQNEYAKPIYSAASATHLYDKPFLSAEACTQLGVDWSEHPFSVKYLIDYNFTKGVNHLVFHTFSHTPQKEVYPGSSFGGNIGFPFVRGQTWWKHMPVFIDYLSRCQYILQQGEYVADVLWFYGDHYERPPFDLDYFPKGYRFDYLNTEILHEKLSVENGKIHVKDAGDYRVILLRDSKDMLLSTARKIKKLVYEGATIVGDRPLDSPSLMDEESDVQELLEIADELWGEGISGAKSFGKGMVYWGMSLEKVLNSQNIAPDVIVPEGLPISWIHRKTTDADIYFVSSTSSNELDVALSFRLTGAYPQLWDAVTGEMTDVKVWNTNENRTNVGLTLAPSGSALLVFPKEAREPYCTKVIFHGKTVLSSETGWYRMHNGKAEPPSVSFIDNEFIPSHTGTYTFIKVDGSQEAEDREITEMTINEDWNLTFENGWDVPMHYNLSKLSSLTEISNEAISHYSGTMVYKKDIIQPENGKRMILELGDVHNIADLWCNDKKVATRWAPPYNFDLTPFMKKGENRVEVKVTNTWRNQLIYDTVRPKDEKKTWTTNPPNKSETDLNLSGLVGPVVLKTIVE